MMLKLTPKAKTAENSQLAIIVARITERNATHMTETGIDLLAAKALVGHGNWGPWLKHNFGWSEKTAQNYMAAAALVTKNEKISLLKPSAIIALAAPSTPEPVKSEVLTDLEVGKVPTPKEIKAKIAAAKATVTPVHVGKIVNSTQTFTGKIVTVSTKPASAPKVEPDEPSPDPDLVARLQAVGLQAAIDAMDAAFPGTKLTLTIGSEDQEAA